MDVVFLDQNKWIDLARVEAGKDSSPDMLTLYDELVKAVQNGKAIFPLTASHILETSKRNDPKSRTHLATIQARLSKGFVFRSRKARLFVEANFAVKNFFGLSCEKRPDNWVVVPGFMQAFDPYDVMVASPSGAATSRLVNDNVDPANLFLNFMVAQDDSSRRAGHAAIAKSSVEQIAILEENRALLVGVKVEMRRKVYLVRQAINCQGYIMLALKSAGRRPEEFAELGAEGITKILESMPTLNAETELVLKLESQSRPLAKNDLCDMESFCVALPYADKVIGERAFCSLATQAKLGEKYQTYVSRSLLSLLGQYANN